jgi:hypothetical protein
MRLITLCFVTLFSLTLSAGAQTKPFQFSPDIIATATASPTPTSLISLTAKTDWHVTLPLMVSPEDAASPEKGEVEATPRPAVLSLKPEPTSLATLAQGRSDSVVGLEFSIGGVRPGGQLRNTELIRGAVIFGFGAGFRPRSVPPLQFDVGVDFIADAIGSPRQQEIFPYYFRDIDDVETLLYFGPRVYVTPRSSPVQLSIGGGGAFAYYKEFLESDDNDPFNFRCFSCEGRSGWGFYALGQLRYQINPIFGVGVTAKYYRVTTEGESFSNNLPRRTKDDWLGFMLTFSFR